MTEKRKNCGRRYTDYNRGWTVVSYLAVALGAGILGFLIGRG